jgi:DNA-binding CsgD family transcriptional regulator
MSPSAVSPRMVGREAELAALRSAFTRSRQGEPAAVVVRGEAGIGKTRLVQELLTEVRDATGDPPVVVAVGQCVDMGPIGAPYSPVRRLLHDLYRRLGDEALRAAAGSATVVATLGTLLPELQDGSAAPPPAGADYVAEAVERVVDNLSREHHLVLVLEDLHWADPASLSLLRTLALTLRGTHLLLVATYRSDDVGRGHPLRPVLAELDRSRSVVGLEVARLATAEVAEQVQHLTGGLPPEALEAVLGRSEGVPFFVEELVELVDGAMPDTLRDLVLARFERLGDTAREVVGTVAVGGVEVAHGVLEQVWPGNRDELTTGLREAVAANVLVAGTDGYRHRHALMQEAVHDQLLPSERVELHRRYASVLQERVDAGDVELLGTVAEHWLAARDLPRAFDATVRGLDHGLATYAPATAARLGERLLELWPQVPDAATRAGTSLHGLTASVADSWLLAADMGRALRVALAALASRPEDPVDRAALHRLAGIALANQGRVTEALDHLRRAVALLDENDDLRALPVLALSLGASYAATGGGPENEDLRRRALSLAQAAGDDEVRAQTSIYLTSAFSTSARLREDLEVLSEALSLDIAPSLRAKVCLIQVDTLARLGEYAEAVRVGEQGVAATVEAGLDRGLGACIAANVGESLLATGQADRARDVLRRSRGLLATMPTFDSYCARLLALTDSWDGRAEDAAALRSQVAALVADVTEDDAEEAVGWAEHDLTHALNLAEVAPDPTARRALVGEAVAVALAIDEEVLRDQPVVSRGLLPGLARACAEAALLGMTETTSLRERVDAVAASLDEEGTGPALAALRDAELRRGQGDTDPGPWEAAVEATADGRIPVRYRHYTSYRLAEALLSADRRAEAAELLAGIRDEAPRHGAGAVATWAAGLARRAGLVSGQPGARGLVGIDALTSRELQVLQLVAQGLTNRQIGEQLFISDKTASVHVSAILAKLGARGRAEAASLYSQHQGVGGS